MLHGAGEFIDDLRFVTNSGDAGGFLDECWHGLELVIILVTANPCPDKDFTIKVCQRPVVVADTHRPLAFTVWAETQGRVTRVLLPQIKILAREFLDVGRQRIEPLPEFRCCL